MRLKVGCHFERSALYRIAEILVLREREISATKNVAFEMTNLRNYNSLQKAFVREKWGWLKLMSRRENCPIPFLK